MIKALCIKCGSIKDRNSFRIRSENNKPRGSCIECEQAYQDGRKKVKCINEKIYRDSHKEEISDKKKMYYQANQEKFSLKNKDRYKNNKEKILIQKKEYYIRNREHIIEKNIIYVLDNRHKINERNIIRRKNDICFKLRQYVSNSINLGLKRKKAQKNGGSILNFLPFTIDELKLHLESLFEPWMSWGNHGKYDSKIWDDDNQSSWAWQIDHIIPHSEFKYESMDCKEFQQCWALENLRPYSAKQNWFDGIKRIRHK